MSAYVIANIRVNDAERYKDYLAGVSPLIEKHGGKYCVRAGESHVLEGAWTPDRFVVLEFPSREAALAFYNDPDYVPLRTLRQSITESNVIVIDGYA